MEFCLYQRGDIIYSREQNLSSNINYSLDYSFTLSVYYIIGVLGFFYSYRNNYNELINLMMIFGQNAIDYDN